MVLDGITDVIASEGRIELRNFGVFEVRRRKERRARNPRTGEQVFVPSKNVVTFKPGRLMTRRVQKLLYAPPGSRGGDAPGGGESPQGEPPRIPTQ
jgi:nucleoid DNA-binding protein